MTPNRAVFLFFSAAVAVFIVQLACTPCNVRAIDPPDVMAYSLTIAAAE